MARSRRRLRPTTEAWSSADAPRGGGPKGLRPDPGVGRALTLRPASLPDVAIRRALRAGFGSAARLLRLDPDENVAPERVELSRAGALGAPQFGFDALDRVLRPDCATSSSTPHPRTRMRMRCSCGEGEGVKSLWRSILDIGGEYVWKG